MDAERDANMNQGVLRLSLSFIAIFFTLVGCAPVRNGARTPIIPKLRDVANFDNLYLTQGERVVVEGSDLDTDRLLLTREGYEEITLMGTNYSMNLKEIIESAKSLNAYVVVVYNNYRVIEGMQLVKLEPVRRAKQDNTASDYSQYTRFFDYWKRLPKPILGVLVRELTKEELGYLKDPNGIYVVDVMKNTPAYDAQIIGGDIITSINAEGFSNKREFLDKISTNAGKRTRICLARGQEKICIDIMLNRR